MLALAGAGALAHAAGFDESLKAPMTKDTSDLRTQVQSYSTRYREVSATTPMQMITNTSAARQQFDVSWQLERAVNERQPLSGLEAAGFKSLGDGAYRVDTRQYPEWRSQGEFMATTLNSSFRDGIFAELLQRGFRPEDVQALEEYIATHDVNQAVRAASLPIALSFQRVVQKFDKAGRPVPDSLVVSYWYQRSRAYFEANRAWSEGLLKSLDAQRVRILLSFLSEVESFKSLIPESVPEGIVQTLTDIRSPDLEKRWMAPEGVAP
jgi:hypothetical protein